MPDEDQTAHTQQGRSAHLAPIETLTQATQPGEQEEGAQPGAQVRGCLLAQGGDDRVGDALGGLERDVADKAIGDHHVDLA